jgi:OOP family OmpA-OmpF porin
LVAMPAMAQIYGSPGTGPDGIYLRGEGGWHHQNDTTGDTTTGIIVTEKPHEGYLFGGALGYKIDQLRLELGLDFSNSDAKSISLNNASSATANGGIQNTAGMINALWDFRTGTPFVPYIGMGVGVSSVSLNNLSRNGVALSNGSDLVFAYQPMVGVNYHISDQLALGLQYRYFATVDPSFNIATGGKVGLKNESHNVLLGLTYYFQPPAPPPPVQPAPVVYQAPPPPPAPVVMAPPVEQNFIVFFDFNRATLTAEGRRVVQKAASYFQQDGAAHVQLTGYTDAVGTQGYNLELSRRRALTVRNYLIELGVPPDEIEAAWRGKDGQRVATPNGVREPQNRRVEIMIP